MDDVRQKWLAPSGRRRAPNEDSRCLDVAVPEMRALGMGPDVPIKGSPRNRIESLAARVGSSVPAEDPGPNRRHSLVCVEDSADTDRPKMARSWGAKMKSYFEASPKHLSPKRKRHGPGLDGWYPYPAGFSYEFVAAILPELIDKNRAVVLDPWNGSGTTTAAASYLGHTSLGFDLNPAVVPIANAKLATADELDSLTGLLESCLEGAREVVRAGVGADPYALLHWLPPPAAGFSRASIDWLCAHDGVSAAHELTPGTALAALCVLHGIREYAVDRKKSNASWVSPNPSLPHLSVDSLIKTILGHARTIIAGRPPCPVSRGSCCRVRVGDARELPVPDAAVDLVFSSPPYCTRVDYVRQTGVELAALAGLTNATSRELRHTLMGTTTIRGVELQRPTPLPCGISELLRAIRAHQSHRSEAYYGRNFGQYFEDAALAVAEFSRVLRPGGKAILVLQNSYYKEIEIELSRNYCELGEAVGLKSTVLVRNPVRRTMTTINSRSRKYREKRNYTEDVILLERPK